GGKTYCFPEENPFKDDDNDNDDDSDNPKDSQNKPKEELGSVGYRYRVFDLGNDIQIVIRCEVNGVLPPTGDDQTNTNPQFVCIRALNEFDSRVSSSISLSLCFFNDIYFCVYYKRFLYQQIYL
ncbi:unnamed protein product, partial [Trichobilharzia regenti]